MPTTALQEDPTFISLYTEGNVDHTGFKDLGLGSHTEYKEIINFKQLIDFEGSRFRLSRRVV